MSDWAVQSALIDIGSWDQSATGLILQLLSCAAMPSQLGSTLIHAFRDYTVLAPGTLNGG